MQLSILIVTENARFSVVHQMSAFYYKYFASCYFSYFALLQMIQRIISLLFKLSFSIAKLFRVKSVVNFFPLLLMKFLSEKHLKKKKKKLLLVWK